MAAGLSWNVFAAATPAAGNAQNASEGKGDIPTYRQDARHDQGYEEENYEEPGGSEKESFAALPPAESPNPESDCRTARWARSNIEPA
eukprot:COSAG01_NODE_13167_length_1625_cov_5.026212_2_plen_88_part_00